jgi:hypothetical protein
MGEVANCRPPGPVQPADLVGSRFTAVSKAWMAIHAVLAPTEN